MQYMNFLNDKNELIPKSIQKVLKERRLWPAKRLNLSYFNLKCFNCQVFAEYKIYVKSYKYETCKGPQQCSLSNCFKNQQYNA